MTLDLDVLGGRYVANDEWLASANALGATIQFHPDFDPASDTWLPISFEVADGGPLQAAMQLKRTSSGPVHAGFEFYVHPGSDWPPPLVKQYVKAKTELVATLTQMGAPSLLTKVQKDEIRTAGKKKQSLRFSVNGHPADILAAHIVAVAYAVAATATIKNPQCARKMTALDLKQPDRMFDVLVDWLKYVGHEFAPHEWVRERGFVSWDDQ